MEALLHKFRKANSWITILLIFGLTFSGNALLAQITITASDFPHAGMLVVHNIDSTTTLSPGSAGTGQVWDFSNLVISYDDSTLYTLPGAQPGAGNHPDANLVAKDLDYDINYDGGYNYIFYETTPGGWLVQGQELKISFWGMSITWHMFYEPPALILPLPFTYNSSNNQSTYWKLYAATGFGGTVIDSVLTINHTTVSQIADASGTMITPEGNYDVLRVKEHTEIVDSSFKYNASSGWVFDETGFTVLDSYRWYANGIGEVGSITNDGKKGGSSFSFFKSSTIVGTQELDKASRVKVFPVPAADILNIESTEPIGKIEIYNQAGALQMVENKVSAVNISGLAPGTYYIKIFNSDAFTTRKFIKQ